MNIKISKVIINAEKESQSFFVRGIPDIVAIQNYDVLMNCIHEYEKKFPGAAIHIQWYGYEITTRMNGTHIDVLLALISKYKDKENEYLQRNNVTCVDCDSYIYVDESRSDH